MNTYKGRRAASETQGQPFFPGMCSVVGCDSLRRSAQRFKLPEDPERRLEWVQFLATVNKQRFKESSWTDITICCDHFKDGSFVSQTSSDLVQLKASAVPSLCQQPEPHQQTVERPKCEEPEEVVCQRDQLRTCDGPVSPEKARPTLMSKINGSREDPAPRDVSCSPDTSDTFVSQPKNANTDLMMEKAALLKMTGKYVVNEKRLVQLFHSKCPSCECELEMEKATQGVLVTLNQKCLQCDYTYHWNSQVNAVPAAEDLRGRTEVTLEVGHQMSTDNTQSSITKVPEIVAVIDEESDPMDGTESSDPCDMDSDEDWKPLRNVLPVKELHKEPNEESRDKGEAEQAVYPPLAHKNSRLCTDCGKFFHKQKSHTCEHKIKPYSCNICGKRCVSEVALNSHSRVHDENHEYRCKYCNVAFKTKVDKVVHEETHLTQEKPYKCPDCSEMFYTNKERRIHLEDHRGPKQLKCHICEIEFLWPLSLQRHLAVHTGERPYKCSVCQRGFNQQSHLKSHMRLHTGERPFKCQHCDKSFNHNVSLKSHVQRYHAPGSGKLNKEESYTGDQGNGNKRGVDSGLDNASEEDTDEEVQEESMHTPKKKKRSTGRPIGRPKSFGSGNFVLAVQVKGQDSNSKRTHCSDVGNEDETADNNSSFDSPEERRKKVNTARSRGRAKYSDSDSDFDPKRPSSINSAKGLGKRRGQQRSNLVV